MKKLMEKFFGNKKPKGKQARSTRVRLLLADAVRLETKDGAFPVVNLSDSGMGFLAEGEFPHKKVSGTLVLEKESIGVEIEVVRKNGGFVGARFLGDGAEVRSALRRHFSEEFHATEMSEVDSSHLAAEEGKGKPRWFYAPGNYELFFLEKNEEGEILELQMEWGGRVLSASQENGLRSGFIHKEDRTQPGHAKSNLIHWESQVSEMDQAKAVRVLENIPGLDPKVRGRLVSLVRGGK